MTPLNVTCGRFETAVARIAALGGANGVLGLGGESFVVFKPGGRAVEIIAGGVG